MYNITPLITKYYKFMYIINRAILISLLIFSASVSANFVDTLIDNMGPNEARLMNAPNTDWAKHGYLDMGFVPRGDNTPSYWARAQGSQFTSSSAWTGIIPWFHIWPVEGNSGESRVKVSNIKVQMLIGNKWRVIDIPSNQWAQIEPWNLIGAKKGIGRRDHGDGAFSYLVTNSGPIHGGLGKYDMYQLGVDPTKIKGVAISAVAEIIEGDGVILFEIGGDFYPNVGVGVDDYKLGWGPAIGGSKFGIIEDKRCLYMTTINPPGQGDPSKFVRNGGKAALTHDELRANPPHDLCGEASPVPVPVPTPTPTPTPVPVPVPPAEQSPSKEEVIGIANDIILRLQSLINLYNK